MRALLGGLALVALAASACSAESNALPACDGVAKMPPNLLRNGGFECGGAAPAEWSGMNGVLSFVTSGASEGSRAAMVVSDSSGQGGVSSSAPVVAATSGKVYCFSAQLKGTASDARLEVFGSKVSSFGAPLNSPNGWKRFPPSTNLEIREPIDQPLYVKVRANAAASGDTVLVDDLDLWESSDGTCRER